MNCNTVNTAKIFANLCCEMTPTQQFQQHCTFQFFAPVDRTLFLNLSCNNKTWWSPVSTARYSIIYGKIVTEQTKHTSRHSEKLKITWFPFKKCHVLWRCITNKSSAVHSNYKVISWPSLQDRCCGRSLCGRRRNARSCYWGKTTVGLIKQQHEWESHLNLSLLLLQHLLDGFDFLFVERTSMLCAN